MGTPHEPFQITDTVGSIVARRPALSRAFEEAGIDYCCGGKITLAAACQKKGIDPHEFLAALKGFEAAEGSEETVDPSAMRLAELADHIERVHHAYLKAELPRLDAMTRKVAAVHGGDNPRLHEVRDTFVALNEEMSSHMSKEEEVLFPLVRQLEAGGTAGSCQCGSIAQPIQRMELEHNEAGEALARLRDLTDGFTPPDWACNTYRAMLDGLAHLEHDMHQHVHKENNVLFPRAIDMEKRKAQ